MPGYRRVPDVIRARIAALPTDTFRIGAARTYQQADLAGGDLAHLGVTLDDQGDLLCRPAVVPPPAQGRWSSWNVHGRLITRRDLPKVNKTFSWDVPIFGDYSKGTVTIDQTRQVFQRQRLYGHNLAVLVEPHQSATGAAASSVSIAFRVDRVFDRSDLGDERDLLMALSLLRENIGSADVVSTDRSVQDWLSDQIVTWELLPVDHDGRMPSFSEAAPRLRIPAGHPRADVVEERYQAMLSLQPAAVIVGTGAFTRYIAFQFRDDLVALENLDYGNALYVMYQQWELLSRRTRLQLLADPDADYDRVIHKQGWTIKVQHLLARQGHVPSDL